jgi:ATP-dependent DNA ligase
VDHKKERMKKLLVGATPGGCEAGYLVRSLQGKLRIGLAQQTVTTALAHAVVLHSEAAVAAKKEKGISGVADLLGEAVGLYKLNAAVVADVLPSPHLPLIPASSSAPHSLKAPGFNP